MQDGPKDVHIFRGVTDFPDDGSAHEMQISGPVQFPYAELFRIDVEGNRVVTWWKTLVNRSTPEPVAHPMVPRRESLREFSSDG